MNTLVNLPKLKKKAQDIFNKWIRNRDEKSGCISCGGRIDHAGHYFSSGHHSALTFDEMNVHGQCLRCNNFLHGNLPFYRIGLVNRYGDEYVQKLERKSANKIKKWDRVELDEIITKYKLK